MKKYKYIVVAILIAAALISTAFAWQTTQDNKIESINLKVYGQSITGEKYTKALNIVNNNGSYKLI